MIGLGKFWGAKNRPWNVVAKLLLEKEVLEGDELRQILEEESLKS